MSSIPYVHDRTHATDADSLIVAHGAAAAKEARKRANASRSQGNLMHFCKWRQVERLVIALDTLDVGTRH